MASNRLGLAMSVLCLCAAAGSAVVLSGCEPSQSVTTQPSQVPGHPGTGQRTFATDDDAAKALLEAVKLEDKDARKQAMRSLFGPAAQDLASGDPVADARNREAFATRAKEQMHLEKKTDALTVLHLGKDDWPFAIPIVKAGDGKWFFDTAAGKEELLARRIGANELATIAVCRAYVLAQREYASKDRDGSGVLKYAQRLYSKPGTKDGLYWPTAAGEEPSPFGPLIAEASTMGYFATRAPGQPPGPRPFQGYFFHILTRQGPHAPGGAYNYVINGNMIAGFALVAWPDKYASSGVMTFLISHQGRLYQKDLGPRTAEIAKAMTEYDPDSTWTLVKD